MTWRRDRWPVAGMTNVPLRIFYAEAQVRVSHGLKQGAAMQTILDGEKAIPSRTLLLEGREGGHGGVVEELLPLELLISTGSWKLRQPRRCGRPAFSWARARPAAARRGFCLGCRVRSSETRREGRETRAREKKQDWRNWRNRRLAMGG